LKKFQVVLVLSFLIIIGFRSIAVPQESLIENQPIDMEDIKLEINIEGGFLGFTVTVINTGPVQIKGNFSIEISTDAMFILFGDTVSHEEYLNLNPLTGIDIFKLKPVIGFGSATIFVTGLLKTEVDEYLFYTTISGYAFIIYVLCDKATIEIP
jgi:hypothetical protein